MKTGDFDYYMKQFLTSYLPGSRNVSENTIVSYRDTFVKLLVFFRDERLITPEKIRFTNLNRNEIEDFLFYLETVQGCGISTRNQRLAAMKSFFRFVVVERPDLLYQANAVFAIKNKKFEKPVIDYLTVDELRLLLKQPDTTIPRGRRDLALLSLMYESAARVQEICDLKVSSVRCEAPFVVRLYGKGRKSRDIPLNASCMNIITKYMRENRLFDHEMREMPLFFNSRREKLSRSGASFILSKYVAKANENGSSISKKITPHCLRHSKAMHMVEAGINLIYIRDYLGHESIETTQVYAKANSEAKRKAVEKMEKISPSPSMPDWNDNPDLMKFLRGI